MKFGATLSCCMLEDVELVGLGEGRGLRALETLLRLLVILAAGAWRSRHLVLLAAWPASRTSAAAPRGRLASLCWRSCARSWPCDHAIPPWIRKKSRVRTAIAEGGKHPKSASAGFPTPNNRFAYSPTARYETATSKSEAERHCWLDGTMI